MATRLLYVVAMGDGLEQCRTCGQDKPRDAFYSLPHTTRVRQPCKECFTARKRARYDGSSSHAQVLREKHQLTPADYARMLAEQNALCAVCGEPETARGRGGNPRRLAVDHDHRTGDVRRLLCHRCHSVTRAVADDPALLDKVRDYLRHHAGDARRIDPGR